MPMYNLIEYNNNYSKTSGTLFQYWRNVPGGNNNGVVTHFIDAHVTDSFNLKEKLTDQIGNNDTKKYWNNGTIKIFK